MNERAARAERLGFDREHTEQANRLSISRVRTKAAKPFAQVPRQQKELVEAAAARFGEQDFQKWRPAD